MSQPRCRALAAGLPTNQCHIFCSPCTIPTSDHQRPAQDRRRGCRGQAAAAGRRHAALCWLPQLCTCRGYCDGVQQQPRFAGQQQQRRAGGSGHRRSCKPRCSQCRHAAAASSSCGKRRRTAAASGAGSTVAVWCTSGSGGCSGSSSSWCSGGAAAHRQRLCGAAAGVWAAAGWQRGHNTRWPAVNAHIRQRAANYSVGQRGPGRHRQRSVGPVWHATATLAI